jgi:hypothetical protein
MVWVRRSKDSRKVVRCTARHDRRNDDGHRGLRNRRGVRDKVGSIFQLEKLELMAQPQGIIHIDGAKHARQFVLGADPNLKVPHQIACVR